QYQNRRADYIKAFAEVIDWGGVQARLQRALKNS
ncbi:MAG: superoxide dismutase, partial [Phycisphaerae bacterium]|nr:superoxide dismutase [Phycisphaerae bacterium]